MRALLLCLPLLAACAASAAAPPVDLALASQRAQCAEVNPLDTVERDACVNAYIGARRRAAARQADYDRDRAEERHARQASQDEGARQSAATAAAFEGLGQSMQNFGRQLSAPPVRCTSIRMGAFVQTTCR